MDLVSQAVVTRKRVLRRGTKMCCCRPNGKHIMKSRTRERGLGEGSEDGRVNKRSAYCECMFVDGTGRRLCV